MDIGLFQKYLYAICFGYFCVKIYYKSLFNNFIVKNPHEELVDFSVTCVMSSIVYLITNFYYPMNNSMFFYVGFIVGTQMIVLKKMLFPHNKDDKWLGDEIKDILFYMLLIIYTIIFIYFYIIKNIGVNIVNPLIIIIGIISIIIGLILTSGNKDPSNNENNVNLSKFKIDLGFFSFLGSLLFINTPSTNVIVTFFQSILIGTFVSEFSYYGPKYFIEKHENIRETSSRDVPDTHVEIDDLKDTIRSNNENIEKLNTNIQSYNRNFSKYCNFKNDIETNKIISGLSYITILIVITIVYINLKDSNII